MLSLAEGMAPEIVDFEKIKLYLARGEISTSHAISLAISIAGIPSDQFRSPSMQSISALLAGSVLTPNPFRSRVLSKLAQWRRAQGSNELSGGLAQEAVASNPCDARGWLRLGDWCYGQSQARVSALTSEGNLRLTPEERSAILGAQQQQLDESSGAFIDELTEVVINSFERSETVDDPAEFRFEDHVRQLAALFSRHFPTRHCSMSTFSDIWRRILDLYGAAIRCYFRYLQLLEGEGAISCPLRLLRLLVRYGEVFEEVFRKGFADTPTSAWLPLVPQLFARLGHTTSSIREQLVGLALQLARAFPQSVVHPATVGAIHGGSPLQSASIARIVTELERQNAQTVADSRMLISELSRIGLLWEDLWIETLQQESGQFASAMKPLREELSKRQAGPETDAWLESAYLAAVKPVLVTLEALAAQTSRPAETPHESDFQAVYGLQIRSAMRALCTPPQASNLDVPWSAFKDLGRLLHQRSKPCTQNLVNLSPTLAGMKQSLIRMPGLELCAGEPLTVACFCEEVLVFATKTKPKKLTMIGSDGRQYPYLLKGKEDLRLDQRISQLLTTVNSFLAKSKGAGHQCLRARNYSVLPLGQNSGLIQWVDGALPLFVVCKEWQRASLKHPKGGAGVQVSLARPVDTFYAKILPALKERKVDVTVRREWPHDVLLSVFNELLAETPKWLLSQALWFASATASDWWEKTQTYSQSLAVMSMIGYVLGLGDRHLDNILIDYATGEVVHIDYNVCFDRGLRLRIPERVPFRLTQNLVAALGFTGVEGTFRGTCKSVLSLLRESSESLLTLLEAFIFDPLVDWEADMPGDESRQEADLQMSLEVFVSRGVELRTAAETARTALVPVFENLQEAIRSYSPVFSNAEQVLREAKALHVMADEAEEQIRQHQDAAAKKRAMVQPLREELKRLVVKSTQASTAAEKAMVAASRHKESHIRVLEAVMVTDMLGLKSALPRIKDLPAIEYGDAEARTAAGKMYETATACALAIAECVDRLIEYQETISTLDVQATSNNFLCARWAAALQLISKDIGAARDAEAIIRQTTAQKRDSQQTRIVAAMANSLRLAAESSVRFSEAVVQLKEAEAKMQRDPLLRALLNR
jgi:hypothetical protein